MESPNRRIERRAIAPFAQGHVHSAVAVYYRQSGGWFLCHFADGARAAHAQGLLAAPGVDPLRTAAIYFNHAAIAIGFAVFFDGMDGAIARLTHTTSDFGKELDSLADVVTFGVAPAILAWMWGFLCLPATLDADLRDKLIQFGAIIAFAFLTAGACRLARFNIQLNPQPKNPGHPGRKYFVGMPIPGGAGCLAAVVHLAPGLSRAGLVEFDHLDGLHLRVRLPDGQHLALLECEEH